MAIPVMSTSSTFLRLPAGQDLSGRPAWPGIPKLYRSLRKAVIDVASTANVDGEERPIGERERGGERESDIRPRFTQKVSKRHVNRLADPTARVHPSK